MAHDTPHIEVRLCLRYSPELPPALDVNMRLPAKGVTAVVGHSGSGKSSLLRCIAGLQNVDGGLVSVGDLVWQRQGRFEPVHRRELGFVFQEASLFSHLNVESNLAYASKRSRGGQDREYTAQVIAMLELAPLLKRQVQGLSGGERQRVAIGRALLTRPKLLMMDEPLASLDTQSKQALLPQLRQVFEELDIPVLYVTHSMDEVCQLAHHVLLLDTGQVKLQGDLNQVLGQLESTETNGVGPACVLEAEVVQRDDEWHMVQVQGAGVSLWLADPGTELGTTLRLRVAASDVSLSLSQDEQSSILNRLPATVIRVDEGSNPALCIVHLQSGQWHFVAQISRRSAQTLGIVPEQSVWAQVKSAALLN